MTQKPSISFFCPAYHDAQNIERVIAEANETLSQMASEYEMVIVDDGNPDGIKELLSDLLKQYEHLRVIHHEHNEGYGQATRSGLATLQPYDIICFTDGDGQYSPKHFLPMLPLLQHADVVCSYRTNRSYGWGRVLLSHQYRLGLKWLFGLDVKDPGSPLKMMHKKVLSNLQLHSVSSFSNAEFLIHVTQQGWVLAEYGIAMSPRLHGRSSTLSWKNLQLLFKDGLSLWKKTHRVR